MAVVDRWRSAVKRTERHARLVEYCERIRSELLDAGEDAERLSAMNAAQLSDLVITTRQAQRGPRRMDIERHPSGRT